MSEQAKARAVLGPFTAREVTYLGGAAVLALASLFSFGRTRGDFVVIMLALLAPLAAAALVAFRRLRERARLDLGSFSLDQLAAVVAAAALVVALGGLGGAGAFAQLLAVIGALGLVAASWGAAWFKVFGADYASTPDVPLLRRDVVPSEPADAWSKPTPDAAAAPFGSSGTWQGKPAESTAPHTWNSPVPGPQEPAGPVVGEAPTSGRQASSTGADALPHTSVIGASAVPEEAQAASFWFAVPDARPAFNRANGTTEFTVEAGTWWLAVRALPEGLVVRHDDGREALLRNTSELELG